MRVRMISTKNWGRWLLLVMSLALIAASAGAADVVVTPANGSGFVVKAQSGNEILRANSAGAVLLPQLPSSLSVGDTFLCFNSSTGQVDPCDPTLLSGIGNPQPGIALQIERLAGGSVSTGSNVVFDAVVFSAGNVSYNAVTGIITFNQSGRYLFNWWVAYDSVNSSTNGAVLALSSSQGDFLEGNSPNASGQVTGVGIIDVVSAPVTVSLVNASTDTITYGASVPLKATLILTQVR